MHPVDHFAPALLIIIVLCLVAALLDSIIQFYRKENK